MKLRYQEATDDLQILTDMIDEAGYNYELQAKHLYYDREEITVHVRLTDRFYGALD